LKILVAVCEATYAKRSLADSIGIWVIEPPREGSLHRAKMLFAGIFKHALRGKMSRYQHGRDVGRLQTQKLVY